ncbi:MAG: site-specific integrase [Prevotellaceae bacterium]|jgi:integrase|nr:site-specific integrase [Prevotellaceae bacterium]
MVLRLNSRLSSKKNSEKKEIYLTYHSGKINITSGSDITISEKWFDYVTGITNNTPFGRRKLSDAENEILEYHKQMREKYNSLKTFIEDEESKNIEKSQITSQWLTDCINKFYKKGVHKEKSLLDHLHDFINEYSHRTGTKGNIFKNLNQYTTLRDKLQEFAKTERRNDFEVSEIDKNFLQNFNTFLNTISKPKPLAANTIGKYNKCLKAVLNDKGLYDEKKCRIIVQKLEVDTQYLSETELDKIKMLDLSKNKKLEKTRNSFIVLAYTGCRISDLKTVINTPIVNDTITFRQQKTNNKVSIPLLFDNTEKYINRCKTVGIMTNTNLNSYIREICEMAGINEMVSITSIKGGQKNTELVEKYKLITSHTGRRSYATNMIERGVSPYAIMEITGHKTLASFEAYIRLDKKDKMEMMKKQFAMGNKKII